MLKHGLVKPTSLKDCFIWRANSIISEPLTTFKCVLKLKCFVYDLDSPIGHFSQ